MTEGTIQQNVPVSIQDELRISYLDYAMSVIIGRAIPDVRDGLKPVHRRILYSMHDQKITASSSYKKCARVVGDVLGKYHPHGDSAVYEALVRMAQDFSLRVPLIDGQGNYGSVDGDSPAAMRYTECRLAAVAGELLADLDKDTVDFIPNYDESESEPSVLPARFPHLLVNGSGGIAVGMATNIPPHNLGEVIDGTIALIDNPAMSIAELMEIIPGPDFPTGGQIHGTLGIQQAYLSGRGSIIMRSKSHVESVQGSSEREQIVVTELPYQCNKARLVSRIAELTKDKRLEGISEVRDESDRDGIRVVVELRKDVFPQVVLNHLWTTTQMQSTFGVINLSIVDGKPRVLDLKQTLEYFVDHRREVVRRRSRFLLRNAEARRELVEGLGMATSEIDAIVSTIRGSQTPDEARARLRELRLGGLGEFLRRAGRPDEEVQAADARGDYQLSETQARAILDMRLARLTGLEREKLVSEYRELCLEIDRLTAILSDNALLMQVIVDELKEVKEKYANPRRTEILENEAEIALEDLIQDADMAVAISHLGYIKRTPLSTYRQQRRGGKGRSGMSARDEDWVKELFVASTHSYVFFFTNLGKVYVKKVYQIPETAANARGRAIVNFVGLDQTENESVRAVLPVSDIVEGKYVTTLTRRGQIKKTDLIEYRNYRETGLIGVRIDEGDELLDVALTDGTSQIIVGTRHGQAIRFAEGDVRATGRATMGVKAIDLRDDDTVVGMGVYTPGDERDYLLTVCELGYGKQTHIDDFTLQGRAGKGVIMIQTTERNGPVVGLGLVSQTDQLIVITNTGLTLRTTVEGIRVTGRNAQGVAIIRVAPGERVVAIERFAEDDSTGTEAPPPPGDDDGSADPLDLLTPRDVPEAPPESAEEPDTADDE